LTQFDREEKHMSTASISMGKPRLRLTRRGRFVFTVLAAIPVVITAMVFALNGGGAVATSGPGTPLETVTIYAGESLWSLAEEIAPSVDPREFISDVLAANPTVGSGLEAGSQLAIPAKYTTP
jgi:Tfp pilus assembly protein FimV